MVVRTRIAPSPTGEHHIGLIRTLLYNYAFAKKHGGQLILRIEDTDKERYVEGSTERMFQVIKDYGLSWDEGPEIGGPHTPYFQSQRLDIYQRYAEQLLEGGHAYNCFCTRERLDKLREEQKARGLPATKYDKHCLHLSQKEMQRKLLSNVPHVIRLNVPEHEVVSFEDKVLGNVSFPTNDIDDQILLKSDGFPTYHLAVVVDDFLMEINVVMRGIEWLPSTPKHILLYRAFGWDLPTYAHLPLLKEKGNNKKLSKRLGVVTAKDFLSEGYLPEAVLNLLMLSGWNPGSEREIYSLEEFCRDFSIDRIHKTDLVVFDREKLVWFNGHYIRTYSPADLYEKLIYWAEKFNVNLNTDDYEKTYVIKVLFLVQDRMRTLKDFPILTHYFFRDPTPEKSQLTQFALDKSKEILDKYYYLYSDIQPNDWNIQNLDERSHGLLVENGYKPKEAFMTLRVALTGETATPPLFEIINLLGQGNVLKRIKTSADLLR